ERALWPAVFDYEDMKKTNLIGWDFVKLEHELKIRLYDKLFPALKGPFITEIQKFETELAKATQHAANSNSWRFEAGKGRVAKLHALLLTIRWQAYRHLRGQHDRPWWWDEYNFLLAAYSVAAGRFENLHQRQRLAGYLVGGLACARLPWVSDHEHEERKRLG